MNEKDTITIFHLSLFAITAIGLYNHVIIISQILQMAGRDAWISVLIGLGFIFAWLPIFIFIRKETKQQHVFQWIKKHLGTFYYSIVLFLTMLYLVSILFITIKETIVWTNITYLQETSPFILSTVLVSICVFAALTSLRTIAITNFFILPFIIVFGFFVSFVNFQVKDFSLIQPVLEHGLEGPLKGAIYPVSGFLELIMVIMLQNKLESTFRLKHLYIIVFLLAWLTTGPLIGSIIEFGPKEAANQRFAAYEQWGLASLGIFIEHLDVLSIYQWMSGAFIRLSLLLFVVPHIFNVQKQMTKVFIIGLLGLSAIIFTLLPIGDIQYYQYLKNIIIPFSIGLNILIIIFIVLGILIYKIKKKVVKNEKVAKS
ncbi:endospore germination permease [Heyndrickxia sp. NPDC080065]|uniref:endospore germination permease n=1 Tax=Heyndrickxia sp. NPDC080065 TaxID=3390568 RepID=UPI003CFCE867